MKIPEEEKFDLITFRDKYCVTGLDNAPDVIDSHIPVRILVGWTTASATTNPSVLLRKLSFEIYVNKMYEYDDVNNALDRRADLIIKRLRYLLLHSRVEGFLFKVADLGDLNSFSYDYSRSFITFTVKNIF